MMEFSLTIFSTILFSLKYAQFDTAFSLEALSYIPTKVHITFYFAVSPTVQSEAGRICSNLAFFEV
jgi:hypothetical protein